MNFVSKLIYQISDSQSDHHVALLSYFLLSIFFFFFRILPTPSTIHEISSRRKGNIVGEGAGVFWENPRRFWKVWFRNDNEKRRKEGRKGMDDRIARARPECQTSGLSGLMRVERRSCLNPNPPNRYVRLSPLR